MSEASEEHRNRKFIPVFWGENEYLVKAVSPNPTISPIIEVLDRLFCNLNAELFESTLSKPVITLTSKGRKNTSSWFAEGKVWQDHAEGRYQEICINPSVSFPIGSIPSPVKQGITRHERF